ncbi:MAG: ATP-binding protein [Clostridia bacterium]|nr:ATP-binding protein [Clostridia bacterium]
MSKDFDYLKGLAARIRSLTVFRALKSDPVVSAVLDYLDACQCESAELAVEKYCGIAAELFERGEDDLGAYIRGIAGDDENVYMRGMGKQNAVSRVISECAVRELDILQEIADLDRKVLCQGLEYSGYLPEWNNKGTKIAEYYAERTNNIGKYGYGIYARFHMFCLSDDGEIIPVKYPDEVRLSELIDYKREQGIIIENTKALLSGLPAANILLTGDAGTGKSSTVKAVVNEFYTEGLRIIEIRKDQLKLIPGILDQLTQNPLKFIIFVDDLSFKENDDNFSALKAILEGSVSARSQNVVIYATSNRRHMVKEKFADREGDEIHVNDSIQETVSLSERFGLHVTFNRPDKATYLDIVHHLADAHGIEYDEKLIDLAAEQYIILRGSTRSARAAKQFVDGLIAGQDVKIK